jgi:hypothetical protein
MASGRLMKFWSMFYFIAIFLMAGSTNADMVTFEDLDLPAESFWNGSDGSGGFISGGAHFSNNYNADWDSWDGFSFSNIIDATATGMDGQYNAITGEGQDGSANYAVAYIGWTSPPTVTLSVPGVVDGLYVTNTNYVYYSMLHGDLFSKKFGGESGNDPDWLMLTITGKDIDSAVTGVVEFYLADFRSDDNSQDYIIDTWRYVDLTSLGQVMSLEFALSSSDIGDWGMNTPAYFTIDTLVYQSIYDCPYTEAGINGYIDPDNNWQHIDPQDPNAVLNPIFRGWATEVISYQPSPGLDPQWTDPSRALGPVTGDNLDIVSLGDLTEEQIGQGIAPGQITLYFDEPIRRGSGYDFVVFENAFISDANWNTGSIAGQMLTELGYVEVSSNGNDFVRFPAVSLTGEAAGAYGTIEIGKIHNLAGKHPNAYGICTGTPFDLKEIIEDPKVVSGLVDVNDIRYVRIVDIPGSGDFIDEAMLNIDPGTWPAWDLYQSDHPIYDAWVTYGSGGLDLEAVGVLREQNYSADIDLNGIVDISDFDLLISALGSHFGQPQWIARCDLAEPKDLVIDVTDMAILLDQWLKTEEWRY